MIVSPLLRGLLGLDVDAAMNRVIFAPHVPADWKSFGIRNLRAGSVTLGIHYKRTGDEIELEIERAGDGPCEIENSAGDEPARPHVGRHSKRPKTSV